MSEDEPIVVPILLTRTEDSCLIDAELYILDDKIDRIKVYLPDVIIDVPINDFILTYSKEYTVGTTSFYSRLKISDTMYLPDVDHGLGLTFQLKYGIDIFVYDYKGHLYTFKFSIEDGSLVSAPFFKDGATISTDKLIQFNRLVTLIGGGIDCHECYLDISDLYPDSPFLPIYLVFKFKNPEGQLLICTKNFDIVPIPIFKDIKLSDHLYLYIREKEVSLVEVDHFESCDMRTKVTLNKLSCKDNELFPFIKRCIELKKSYVHHTSLIKSFYPSRI